MLVDLALKFDLRSRYYGKRGDSKKRSHGMCLGLFMVRNVFNFSSCYRNVLCEVNVPLLYRFGIRPLNPPPPRVTFLWSFLCRKENKND
jgi:hypothetical protein